VTLLRQAALVAAKDIRIEVRGRHAVATVVPFAATLLVALGLAMGPGRALLQRTAPALLWVAVLFAAVLASRQAYRLEAEDGALEGLVLSPVDRAAVFVGKVIAVTLQLLTLEVFVLLLVGVLFELPLAAAPGTLAAAFALGTAGIAATGSLFGILSVAPRARETVLPLLVLPLASPVLLAGVRATEVAAGAPGEAGPWLGLLVAFDAVFLALGVLVFGYLLED
jgi:heme exporter protein B